jgi:hypothetical protein
MALRKVVFGDFTLPERLPMSQTLSPLPGFTGNKSKYEWCRHSFLADACSDETLLHPWREYLMDRA